MFSLADIAVGGYSIAGIETCLDFPKWKFAVDIGRCPHWAVNRPTLFFTHAHMDHMGGVASHAATRELMGMKPPTYVIPRANQAAFEKLFDAWRALDGAALPHHLVALEPGEEHVLPNGLIARPFHSPHRTTCQGYAFYKTKKQLKPDYRAFSQEELKHRRVDLGEEITDTLEICELAVTGDATIDIVETVEAVRTARLLVMEVTSVDEQLPMEKCSAIGHIHLDQVIERAELFANEAILLTHFSARYSAAHIRRTLEEKLPASLRSRVTPLLEGFR